MAGRTIRTPEVSAAPSQLSDHDGFLLSKVAPGARVALPCTRDQDLPFRLPAERSRPINGPYSPEWSGQSGIVTIGQTKTEVDCRRQCPHP
jgi:hypothetical protein